MICNFCLLEKENDKFYRGKKCKSCNNKYMVAYLNQNTEQRQKRRSLAATQKTQGKLRAKTLVDRLKKAPCMDCTGVFHPEIMEFDHRPGNKQGGRTSNVSELVARGRPTTTILDEISKCDLVCANCHRKRTVIRRIGLEAYQKMLSE